MHLRKVLSLFDGMSCGQEALKRAGITYDVYLASEIDPYAIKVCLDNYPNTQQLGDVSKIDFTDEKFSDVDLIIGGTPCQGFSRAGQQLKFDDPRSKLFFKFVEAVNTIKPKWFMCENVKMDFDSQMVFSEHLNVLPVELNSNVFSAQNRIRLFWTNIKIPKLPPPSELGFKDVIELGAEDGYYSERMMSYLFGLVKRGKAKRVVVYGENSPEKFPTLTLSHGKGPSRQRCFGIQDYFGLRFLSRLECERLQTIPPGYTGG